MGFTDDQYSDRRILSVKLFNGVVRRVRIYIYSQTSFQVYDKANASKVEAFSTMALRHYNYNGCTR